MRDNLSKKLAFFFLRIIKNMVIGDILTCSNLSYFAYDITMYLYFHNDGNHTFSCVLYFNDEEIRYILCFNVFFLM